MIEMIETIAQFGVLGAVTAFFMVKDVYMNKHIVKDLNAITRTLDKITIIIDERIDK